MATWYVRPSGGSYGAEDGTSYADAWDGFTNIVWGGVGVVAGDTLYVCGTHNEDVLDIGVSGSSGSVITIRGDYTGDAGIIDCDVGGTPITNGIVTGGYDYITIMNMTVKDGGSAAAGMISVSANSTNITVDNLTIEPETDGRGLTINPGANSCTVQNCTFTGDNKSGRLINFYADATASIDSLTINNNTFTNPSAGDHIYASVNAAQDITNLTISNNNFSGGAVHGILLYASGDLNNVIISNNTFTNIGTSGAQAAIRLNWGDDHPLHTIEISDNTITNCWRGIEVYVPTALYVTGIEKAYGVNVNNNSLTDTGHVSIRFELVTSTGGTSYIQNNTVYRAGGASGEDNVNGLRVGGCIGVIIQNNEVSYTNSTSGDGNGIIIDRNVNVEDGTQCDGVICRYNVCHNNITAYAGGISNFQSINSEIYYNICYSNISGIRWGENIGSDSQSSGGLLYNNTMYGNSSYGGMVRENALSSTWKNNIAWENTTQDFIVDVGGTSPTATHNCYENESGWTTDTTDIRLNPKFSNPSGNDYLLQSNSPCKDSGNKSVWSGTASITDYAGNRITNAAGQIVTPGFKVSMGAHQHQYNKSIRKPILSAIMKKLKFVR